MVMASIRPAGSEEYGEVASLIQEMASVQGRAELASLQQAGGKQQSDHAQ